MWILALEIQKSRWKDFRNALSSAEEKQAFDALMDMCRNNAMASGNACNPILFDPMIMSILLVQQKEIEQLEYKLNEARW